MSSMRQLNHVSFSSINTFLRCSEKFNKRYIEKIESIEPTPDYFHIGKIVDRALGAVHSGDIEGFSSMLIDENIVFAEEKWKHFCKGVWLHRANLYNAVFGDANVQIQKLIEYPLLNKETGEIIIRDSGYELNIIGYLDGYDSANNKIYEIKTGDVKSIDEYAFAGQTQLYCLGIMREYNVPVPAVEYVFIKKPRFKIKKGESEAEFFQRMQDAGSNPEVTRVPIQYDEQTLIETANYLINAVQDNVDFVPTKNRNECIKYGKKCEYFSDCWKNAFFIPEIKSEEDAA